VIGKRNTLNKSKNFWVFSGRLMLSLQGKFLNFEGCQGLLEELIAGK